MEEEQEKSPAASHNENEKTPANATGTAYAAIAERVRTDSTNRARLTTIEALSSVIPEPEKIQSIVTGMMSTETHQDIKLLVAADGVRYLYSEKAITRRDAERFAFGEEVRSQIVVRVRDDSSKLARLTSINTLAALIPGAEPDKIDGHLALLLDDERYKDIHLIANSKGNRYLYSEEFLTSNYAEILARTEMKDPFATIATTVRDESRVYPRPTSLETFKTPVFNVTPDDVERFASELVKRPEYKDIRLVQASTGTIYLYSDLFLDPEWVKATVEWEEVGKHQNP